MSLIYEALANVMQDVDHVAKRDRKTADRHFANANAEPGDCWVWSGPTDKNGYGLCTIHDPKRTRGAHRVALARHRGIDVDDLRGLVVRHACDNPPCVNPHHLSTGTQADNVQDMIDRGRAPRTERSHCKRGHELTDDNVYVQRATGKRRCAQCHRDRQSAYDRRVTA